MHCLFVVMELNKQNNLAYPPSIKEQVVRWIDGR